MNNMAKKDVLAVNNLIRQVNQLTVNVQRTLLAQRGEGMDVLDSRRDIARECGWNRNPTLETYSQLYEEEGIAQRVVNVYPDECWAVDPEVYETAEDTETSFEKDWNDLLFDQNPFHYLHRVDVLSGIGHYGCLLFGYDDGADLERPAASFTVDGSPRANAKPVKLAYLRAFDQTQVQVVASEKNSGNRRYGQPTLYQFSLAMPEDDFSGNGTILSSQDQPAAIDAKVHWTRVLHVADGRRSSEVYGTPRMKPVLNRIGDLRKVLGGSAEMFWQGAFPGFSLETLPELAEDADIDMTSVKEQIKNYVNGLQRWIALQGMTTKQLAPQVADPTNHVEQQLRLLCATIKVPTRVFLGSEAGQMAGDQDVQNWNRRVGSRERRYIDPMLLGPFVKRLIDVGALSKPNKRFYTDWQDLNAMSDKDKADVALKKAQAVLQYVTSGAEVVCDQIHFWTDIMGAPLKVAQAIVAASASAKPEDLKTGKIWLAKKALPGAPGVQTGKNGSNADGNRPPRNALGTAAK